MKYLTQFGVKNKRMQFPIYLPDATRGVVRSIDAGDLKKAGVRGIVVNTYHLMSQPGTEVLESAGGIKPYMGWDGWVVSDSGGFQLLSLIYRNKSFGHVTTEGVVFHRGSSGEKKKYRFTPEKSIQVQFSIGADILICLDDCPAINARQEKYARDARPVSQFCDCYACKNYSRAYLHHLFKIGDPLAWRLSTIHNLRTYTKLIEALRKYVC